MRNQCLIAGCAAALSLFNPARANAEPADVELANTESSWPADEATSIALKSTALKSTALKWEIAYLALSAIDAGQTIHCLRRDICEEVNPLFGKRPSTKTILLTKVGGGLAHFALFSYINNRNPTLALRAAQISVVGQGGTVLLNARIMF
jgi:hypothetical protein